MALRHPLTIPDWENISLNVYKELVSESKERFEDVSQESYTITKRGLSIFTLMLIVSGFLIPRFEPKPIDYSICITIGVLFLSSAALMVPRSTKRKGTLFNEIQTPELTGERDEIMQEKVYYCSQLDLLYNSCISMETGNRWRIYCFQFSQYIIVILLCLLFSKFT